MPGPDKDVHISLEDQQKINKFARSVNSVKGFKLNFVLNRHNQRLEDIKDELKMKEAELVTLGDASNDVEEFSLTSEDGEKISYMVGEIFVKETPDDVLSLLDNKKTDIKAEIKVLEDQATSIKGVMTDLKTHLYAKFGDAINLEADE